MSIRTLLVDDHPIFRDGLAALLGTRSERFTVIGHAGDGGDAVRLCRELQPDLVLMDIRMPGMRGLEATRIIKAEQPQIRIVILSASEDSVDLFDAVQAGAQGYVLKNLGTPDILDLLERAAAGEAAFTPDMAVRSLELWGRSETTEMEPLSPREHEVLKELVKGASNAAIAQVLEIGVSTVRFHLRNILTKLHAHSRTEAAVRALSRGLISAPEDQTH